MASISKRKYWADPNTGREVPRGTPGAVRKVSRCYRIRYVGVGGKRVSVKAYPDLAATRQLAARLEAAAARGQEQLVDKFSEHNKKVLKLHMEDYLRDLELEGKDNEYRYIVRRRLLKLMKECRWTRLHEITAQSFHAWRSERFGKKGSTGKTLNQYFEAVRSWMNWAAAKERGRIRENPIAGLEPLPHSPTFVRRALDRDQLEALIATVPEERMQVYVTAVTTGLRRQELSDLQWGDVVLDTPSPFLQLRDIATKARRADTLALMSEVAAMLRRIRPEKWEAEGKVFENVPSAVQLRKDLGAAGVELPPEGSKDRVDFHGLRTTLGSFIGKSDIPERVGMELLRVTDPKLLRRTYCDPRILQTAQAVQRVALPPPRQEGSELVSVQIRTAPSVGDGRTLSGVSSSELTVRGSKTLQFEGVTGEMSGLVGPCPGDQKMHQLGLEPRTR